MVSAFRYHLKATFWFGVFGLAALAAYCTLQQITFVPGVPFRGHLQVYAILLLLWAIAIVAAWFLVQLVRFLVRRGRREM